MAYTDNYTDNFSNNFTTTPSPTTWMAFKDNMSTEYQTEYSTKLYSEAVTEFSSDNLTEYSRNATEYSNTTSASVPLDMTFVIIYYVNVIGEIVIGAISVIGNGMVMYLIAIEPSLQTITNYFVASLAAADFLVGIIGVPCVLVAWHGLPYDFYGCLMVNSIIVILTQISIFGLLAIAIERFVAIKHPFQYQEYCTGKLVLAILIFTWLAAVILGIIPLFGWNLGHNGNGVCSFTGVIDMKYIVYLNFFICVLLPLLIMFAVYCYIFHVVRQQLKQIAALQIVGPKEGEAANKSKASTFFKELKAAKWFAVVITFFAVCWLPIHIMNTITLLTSKLCFPCLVVAILFSHLNSALNPLFYAYGNTKFMLSFQKRFCCKNSINPADASIMHTYRYHIWMSD